MDEKDIWKITITHNEVIATEIQINEKQANAFWRMILELKDTKVLK